MPEKNVSDRFHPVVNAINKKDNIKEALITVDLLLSYTLKNTMIN